MIDVKEMLIACIDYIENNINNKISLDDISHHIGISKYYLHRVFKSLTGESIIEYAQSRKLTLSINELINTNMRVIDIALEYGFEYEQSYIRAFKKKFGYTPFKIRTDQISMVTVEKINAKDILSVNNSVTYKPFFVFKQKFDLVGKKHKILNKTGDKAANLYGKEFFYNHKNKVSDAVNPQIYFGYTDWSGNDNGYIYYIPSVQVAGPGNIPDGMTLISIPAHKYVVFRFVGFFRPDEINGRRIGRLLVHMYSKWIYNSGFRFADKFRFEYIDTSLSGENYCELDIYQPIEEI